MSKIVLHLVLTSISAALLVLSLVYYIVSVEKISHANESRSHSLLLAGELHQTSNDLTRMVRSYVATGDPKFKQSFKVVLGIRNGKIPRPNNMDMAYWDLKLANNQQPFDEKGGQPKAVALLKLMKQAGFTAEEFTKMEEAKLASDKLSITEQQAMLIIEGAAPVTDADRVKASTLLHDSAYYNAKGNRSDPSSLG